MKKAAFTKGSLKWIISVHQILFVINDYRKKWIIEIIKKKNIWIKQAITGYLNYFFQY